MTLTLSTITEPDGTIHAIERRTCDLGLIYSPWELTQLILGYEVHRFPRWHDAGRETHVFPEAVAERLAGERETITSHARPGFIRGELMAALGLAVIVAACWAMLKVGV
jgi:hypothetical protein